MPFRRDDHDRLVYDEFDVERVSFKALRLRLEREFGIEAIAEQVSGGDLTFQTFACDGALIELAWDNWSGFYVRSIDSAAEASVQEIGEFLSQSSSEKSASAWQGTRSMPIDTALLREHVDEVRDADTTKAIVRAALDRYEALVDVVDPSPDDLDPIVAAATVGYVLAWTIGADLLLDLASRSRAALDAVLRIVAAGRASEKYQLIAALDRRVPEDLAAELVRFAIHDGSSRVRVKAAEKIERLELDLVDELRTQVENETHHAAKSKLERLLTLCTLGYEVEHDEDGSARILVRTRSGWVGFGIDAADMAAGRLNERIDEARRRHERIHG